MSANYTCNQFDKAYKPTRLGNWEVPKWHLNRPKGRSTVTKVIANDKGHLLPGVHKTDQKHWAGLYLGTYQLPKRISKENAIELSNPKCETWMKRSYHHPFIDHGQRNKNENHKLEKINNKDKSMKNEDTDRDSIKSAVSNVPVKSSAVETIQNCTSANDDNDSGSGVAKDGVGRAGGVAPARTPSSPALSRISAGDDDGNENKYDVNEREEPVAERSEPPGRRYGDVHKHHGLPDTIEDAVYRSLQTKRHKHPGLGLNGCWPKCSAVAYKSFNDPGPTQCSKLRVYRPKTSLSDCENKGSTRRRSGGGGTEPRPKTCGSVMTVDQLTDIKLALCWDLDAPFDRDRPPDEPAVFHKVRQQRPPCGGGIDGGGRKLQNSSAVMGFVGNGNDVVDSSDVVPEARRMQSRECLLKNRNLSAVMELIPNKDRPVDDGGHRSVPETAERNDDVPAAEVDQIVPDKPSSSSSTVRHRSSKDLGTGRDEGKSNGDRDVTNNDDGKHHDDDDNGRGGSEDTRPTRRRRISPTAGHSSGRPRHRSRHHQDAEREMVMKNHQRRRNACRPCLACDDPTVVAAANGQKDHDECHHYKMAFKAGVPVSTPVKCRAAAASKPGKYLKVPKPKTTNSDKKKYVIGTLLPPFSMWPGTTARDYPEHWRLTSVYRQAFKPLELRKQPLLQTIYL
uniref:Cilia- and flagella-associated protein 126 n=1 Tax=Sipha flava TaxID=143950 RepID=A0A2S2Q4Q3_9HEMI